MDWATMRRVRGFVTQHERLSLAIVLGIGLVLRLPTLPMDTRAVPDVQLFIDWGRTARDLGFVAVSDTIPERYNLYPPLALWLLRGLASIEAFVPPALRGGDTFLIVAIKALPLIADLALAYLIARLVRARGAVASVVAAAAIAWNPALIWLGAVWGQIDSVYTFLLVASVAAFERAAVLRGWIAWAAATFIKVQGLMLAPLAMTASLRDAGWRRTLIGCLAVLAMGALLFAPWMSGGVSRYLEALTLVQPRTTFSALNLWYVIGLGGTWPDTRPIRWHITPRIIGYVLVLAVAAFVMLAVWTRRARVGLALPAAILAMAPYMTMTGMRSRYLIVVLPFLVLLASGWDRKAIVRHAGWVAGLVTAILLFNLVGYVPPDASWWLPFTSTKVGPPLQPLIRLTALAAAIGNTLVFTYLLASLWRAARREPADDDPPATMALTPDPTLAAAPELTVAPGRSWP